MNNVEHCKYLPNSIYIDCHHSAMKYLTVLRMVTTFVYPCNFSQTYTDFGLGSARNIVETNSHHETGKKVFLCHWNIMCLISPFYCIRLYPITKVRTLARDLVNIYLQYTYTIYIGIAILKPGSQRFGNQDQFSKTVNRYWRSAGWSNWFLFFPNH